MDFPMEVLPTPGGPTKQMIFPWAEFFSFEREMAKEHGISRRDQDEWAIQSYQRAQLAYGRNGFDTELVHIEIPNKKGPPITIKLRI